MQPGSNPSLRLILAHLEHPTGRLDLSPDAPPGNKGSSERRISKVDREGVVQHPAGSRGRHSPTVRTAVLVEPIGHLRVPLPETFGGMAILMRTGKRRSAKVIITRGLPGISVPFSF